MCKMLTERSCKSLTERLRRLTEGLCKIIACRLVLQKALRYLQKAKSHY